MKIIILDSRPMDGGDLDWTPLRALAGEGLVLHEQTAPSQVAERIAGADVVCTNKAPLDAAAFAAAAPRLRLISVLATGVNVIDLDAARAHGVTVCNVPGYSTASVAQATIGLLLELAHGVGHHAEQVRGGAWQRAGVWSFSDRPLVELDGKTLVIVGLGAIGRRVAQIAGALGMTVFAARLPGRPDTDGDVPRLPLNEALARADAVTLHCPLTPETHGLMNAERLAGMKPSAFLVNTARGPLVDEGAVADALRTGRLAGYAADVLAQEPPDGGSPLLRAPRCLITPHLGWATRESRRRLLDATVANVRAFLAGAPQNVVG